MNFKPATIVYIREILEEPAKFQHQSVRVMGRYGRISKDDRTIIHGTYPIGYEKCFMMDAWRERKS
jgi:hypothetical protein